MGVSVASTVDGDVDGGKFLLSKPFEVGLLFEVDSEAVDSVLLDCSSVLTGRMEVLVPTGSILGLAVAEGLRLAVRLAMA